MEKKIRTVDEGKCGEKEGEKRGKKRRMKGVRKDELWVKGNSEEVK